ncbi:MAG: ATP-binding cassette domain-containing protein, partial [Burkholderiales bacterium]
GKSTLLHLIAGLLKPSEGTVEAARPVGIVPQKLHLIASLTVAENLLLAQYLAGARQEPARAAQVLASVGLAERAAARPRELSHGEAQRAAVARAVMNRPRLLLADEPTSNLDDAHCAAALDLLETQAAECGATLVVATHDARARPRFEKRLELGA